MKRKKYIFFNKKIYHDFYIKEEIEAGIILKGWEVKSLKLNKVAINNSYVNITSNNRVYLLNSHISPLSTACNYSDYIPNRKRELLLNKKELNNLKNYIHMKGFTIVVIGFFWKRYWCKLQIAVAKGKKEYDKRSLLKQKEWKINKLHFFKKSI
ncbi:SsrA-binding protein SmpB [Enterobacteriaceae endosymbiont of Donacia tomentosa]|uniref:SsrA-binding protein SmpB n=1 Tax=Enterobacteriaceae endosymbiont of Donacia tomentosa TaxID=2675787 RepID=UPI001448FC97|nr:SsrA-binding protein SmpB [Enterobacteriaceae endosymbiont of Donacia tomentosa]QJC31814.1 SsrA-binding protein SmpB [Enterobacteriaceae endosymbiont of Donacia tomentosa]